MESVTVDALRRWLAEGKPVTVLDIRTQEDREEWSIPGSMHVNAYDALKEGRPDVLSGVPKPAAGPIVTVCNRGKVSEIAAKQLRARGIDATSLAGGMRAWSLAWNIAEVKIRSAGTQVIQVRRTGKGCLSYVAGSADSAVVIDASLDPSVYISIAETRGWHIDSVFDTHVHADHRSRARVLAEQTEATLFLPAKQRVKFGFQALTDGSAIKFGSSSVSALRTPGHTAESICYLLDESCVMTGDTLFLAAVGRPDLHAHPEEACERARLLYKSLTR